MTEVVRGRADPHAQAVYAWERDTVERQVGPEMLSSSGLVNLAFEACALLGIGRPRIVHLSSRLPCRAVLSTGTLEIAEWGRTRVTLLHEIAHFGTIPALRAGEPGHGPSFVRCEIGLFGRFLGMDEDWLVETATARGIPVGPGAPGTRAVVRREEKDFFEGDW